MDKYSDNKFNKRRSLGIVLFSVFCWIFILQLFGLFASSYIEEYMGDLFSSFLKSIFIPYGIAMPFVYLFLKKVEPLKIVSGKELSLKSYLKLFIIQSGLSVGAMFIVNVILVATGLVGVNNSSFQELNWFLIFILLVFNPIAEEFFFRKLILDRLLFLGVTKAILISSGLFAFPHVFSQGFSAVFYTFILGLVWGYARVRTNSLIPPILLHSLSNIWGGILPSILTKSYSGMIIYGIIWVIVFPIVGVILLLKSRKSIKSTLSDGY